MDRLAQVFPPEMMYEREKQLMMALLDCTGVFYDANFSKDRIIGTPIQVVEGVQYDILEKIGKEKNCSYTEIIDYWLPLMPEEERAAFAAFSDIARIQARYAAGERLIGHKFWTRDVLGNRMLAEQKIRLYEDKVTGDLLGLIYVSNGGEIESMRQKEAELAAQYHKASVRADFLETMGVNLPGGYHRCGTGDGFPLDFMSDSFVRIVGWTREQVRDELDNRFINLVAPEDRDLFMSHEPSLVRDGQINVAYRIRRRDGSRRWVQDSTLHVEKDGLEYYQCILMDITDFVHEQEELSRRNLELMQRKNLLEIMEANMPSGYHRCKAEEGCPFLYIGKHFTDIVGFTKEEIERDFGNLYRNLVWPEDAGSMQSYEQMLAMRGQGNHYDTQVYRMRHKDGGYRWVTDSTMFVDMGEDSFFQATIADITEYMESLNEARARAEASNQAKSTFLFNASHDIRTPMNAIKGFAHIIEQNVQDPQVVAATVRKIQQASDTLMTLMNDVLDLARIERGKEEIKAENVNLNDHSGNLYGLFAADMEQAGVDFQMQVDITHRHVVCDPLKMTRIGMNMLSNAKKFTPAGGRVTCGIQELHAGADTATYRFFTRDTGIGMSEAFLARAFEQFERERTSTESGVTGSGLGLAIIKRLVELMGGQVAIQSELGKGTEISATLTFPLVQAHAEEAAAEEPQVADLSGKRVLLVEDNDFNREIAHYVFEHVGFAVDEAENGVGCLEKLTQSPAGHYDFILMDVQMPIMDGYTATREIRRHSDPAIAQIPIIAMTANAFEEDRRRCLEAGMDGHIGKPLEAKAVLREITRVLSK